MSLLFESRRPDVIYFDSVCHFLSSCISLKKIPSQLEPSHSSIIMVKDKKKCDMSVL